MTKESLGLVGQVNSTWLHTDCRNVRQSKCIPIKVFKPEIVCASHTFGCHSVIIEVLGCC